MANLTHDLSYSLRTLRKSPGFAITAILTLALGIGAVTSIFSVVDSVLLKPFAFPDPGRLVSLREYEPGIAFDALPVNPKHFLNWQATAKTFSGMAAFQNGGFSLSSGTDHPEIVNGLRIAPNFFSVLGTHPALGRDFLPEEATTGHDTEVILSWNAWQRYFHGDPGAIGSILRNGGTPFTVVGVLPRGFSFPRVSEIPGTMSQNAAEPYEVFAPMVYDPNQLSDSGDFNYMAVGRLRVGVSNAQAQSELNTIQAAFNQAKHLTAGPTVIVLPLLAEIAGRVSSSLWLLLASVGAVLLIGCVNLANLQLARAVSRDRELAVRAALGAGRDRLVWSALADSLILAVVGGSLGILLSFAGVRLFIAAAPQNMPRLDSISISWPVLLGAAGISILTALLFGLLPALRSMRIDPQSALQTSTTRVSASRDSQRTRHLLVAAEVACTVALLIVTGLLVRSFATLLDQNRDFDASHVSLVRVFLYAPQYGDTVPKSETVRAAFVDRALQDLAHIPGVRAVASTSEEPMAGATWIDNVERPDRPLPPERTPDANIRWVSPSYAATLRIPLAAGRDLSPSDKDHPKNVLISHQAAQIIFPGENAVGKQFNLGDDKGFTVVGVLADARINDLKHTANMIYIPYWENPWWRVNFLVRSPQPTSALASAIQRTLWNIDPQVAIPSIKSMDQQVSDSVAGDRFQTLMLSSFGAAALLLALLGIYGVLAYSVSLRQREFGIRIALGSDKASLMRFVARQAAMPVFGGILAGLALAFAATRWVHSMLYETSAADPAAIAGSVGLLIVVALLATLLPARRAARVDPVQVLRNE
ncbi:MAG TPA: ABC transporter permease [Acidobacteriaceae bacterium]|jgi:predicted permease|nr:ABC transporter permease [Acidobacteriaceae bacterium]